MTPEQSKKYWEGPEGMLDLCARLSWTMLYREEYQHLWAALNNHNAEEMEHVTAAVIVKLVARKKDEDWMAKRWIRLSELRKETADGTETDV
jgi:hypothetical protein